MEKTAKILPFPGAEKQAIEEKQPLTWERLRDTAPPPKGAPHIHLFDSITSGFGAYITSTNFRSYFVECAELQPDTKKWKRVRVTMHKVAECKGPRDGNKDVQAARAEAIKLIEIAKAEGQISKAAKAAAEKLAAKPTGALTFEAACQRYMSEKTGRNGNPHRPWTRQEYDRAFEQLASWHKLELFKITRAEVSQMVTELRAASQERLAKRRDTPKSKHTSAHKAMVFFRAVWRFHAAENEAAPACPTIVLAPQRKWVKLSRRTRQVDRDLVPAWWEKLAEMTRTTDYWGREWWSLDQMLYFKAVYLLGGRASEIRFSQWKHWDPNKGIWHFPGSTQAVGTFVGNKSERDHEVHVGPYLKRLLEEHRARKSPDCRYIFADAADRVLGKPCHAVDQFRKVFPDFPKWSPHDFRRTFLSVANSKTLALPAKVQKLLVNHECENSDVTEGYVGIEDLQYWSARMETELLKRAGVDNKAAGKASPPARGRAISGR